ncbi:response regulator [Asticcacaulis benevestitus]|uniref:response regulator n=1 Tax=Asticcacaulis benevestitus TaxID=347481 RepID=UPI00039E80E9|nr:response regulator [Asticcacaulis benevestitus]
MLPDTTVRCAAPEILTPEIAAPEILANVLLVDDRRADIELTRVFLQVRDKIQFNMSVAHSAREALEALKQVHERGERVDLLLLDINMPGMDGFEMLACLRDDETLNKVAVIMCTGSTCDLDQSRARELGASGYMVKPASLTQLKTILATLTTLRLTHTGEAVRLTRIT